MESKELNYSPLLQEDEIEEQDYTTVPKIEGENPPAETEAETAGDGDTDDFFGEEGTASETGGAPLLDAGGAAQSARFFTGVYSENIPPLLADIFGAKTGKGMPRDITDAVRSANLSIQQGFDIKKGSQVELSLANYLQSVNFTAPTPGQQLLMAAAVHFGQAVLSAYQIKKDINRLIDTYNAKREDTGKETAKEAA